MQASHEAKDSWGSCQHTSCGPGGKQMRIVWCSEVLTNGPYPPEHCIAALKPASERPCFHVCDYHKYQYGWHIEQWDHCKPRDGKRPCDEAYGVQTRNVSCRAKCGSTAPVDDVCSHFVSKPSTSKVCKLKCPQNCVVTEFGEWSDCNNCWIKNRSRYRTVLQSPENNGHNCTELSEQQPCILERECFENRHTNFQFKVGNWTECLSFHSVKGKRKVQGFTSVLGHRRRTVDCINIQGDLVDKQFCDHLDKPQTIQLCILPKDCLVSHWTNWTSFGQSLPMEKDLVLTRQRNVLQVPRGQGHTCPALVDERTAPPGDVWVPNMCHRFTWVEGSWSQCKVQVDEDTCGAGVQNRTILCVKTSDTCTQYSAVLTPVPDPMCASEAPSHTRSCEVPCPQDCMLSSWSAWSECLPHQCKIRRGNVDDGYRVRSRSIIRPWEHGGKMCPHLRESQPCIYPACYVWRTERSPVCDLKYPQMQCGEGTRKTYSDCISNSGEEVSPSLCFADDRPKTRLPCEVPCANDCVATDWSSWTLCANNCGRVTGFRTRKRDILANPGPDGAPCPTGRDIMERKRCIDAPCETYHWRTTSWGRCELVDHRRKCGKGFSHREAACFRNDNNKVAPKRCPAEEKPLIVQNCTVPCPIDCVVSAFTDWSQCPLTCIPDDGAIPQQHRVRYVMTAPMDGRGCPKLFQSQDCLDLPRCLSYRWQLSEWSHCMYAMHYEKCGDGYRAREVRCINSKDEYLPEEICISQLGSMPDSTQACFVPCDYNKCKFSAWSEWSGCTNRCNGYRTRKRAMEGVTNRISECYERKEYNLEEKELCRCPSLMPQPIDRWSACILDMPVDTATYFYERSTVGKLHLGDGYCGVGRRHQALICVDDRGHNASAAVCKSPDFVEEMCFVPCPQDCMMSPWTSWTECKINSRCGNGVQTRSRYMMEMHLDGGRQCPQLIEGEEYQEQPCTIRCGASWWHVDEWSSCMTLVDMSKGADCGPGLQRRRVRCLQNHPSEDPVEVVEDMCDRLTKPKDANHCQVPCPGQCVTSQWTAWTNCSNACERSSYRERSREIVRQPGEDTTIRCSELRQRERCKLGDNCFTHVWNWSDWGACVMDQEMPCGTGNRKRVRECLRNDGVPVSGVMCSLDQSEQDEQLDIEACTVNCPVDCEMAEWTQWTGCSHTCGLGYQSRSRSVLLYPAHGGRTCPPARFQERPCSYVECFRWELSDWSHCQIEVGACGYGLQRKNLTCRRHDGTLMDKSLCPEQAKAHFKMERSCFRPCPGDCHLSEWSEWGMCHRPCHPGFPDGQQTRSRAVLSYPSSRGEPCEGPLWESRPCTGGDCPAYMWRTSYWFGDHRKVWCQRSDGIKVNGACREAERPITYKECSPPCTVPNSYCQDINKCACGAGYIELYNEHRRLYACELYTASHNKSKDPTWVENQALQHPEDGHQGVWMYAVIAAGCAFLIFGAVAIVTLLKHSKRRHRRRRNNIRRSDSKCSNDLNGSSPLVSKHKNYHQQQQQQPLQQQPPQTTILQHTDIS